MNKFKNDMLKINYVVNLEFVRLQNLHKCIIHEKLSRHQCSRQKVYVEFSKDA